MTTIILPTAGGALKPFALPDVTPCRPERSRFSRIGYAAAHVVAGADPASDVDWEATLRFRHYLWDCGLGVAEAMDTAQRGSGLSWPMARQLIGRTLAAARSSGAEPLVVCGCGTDQLAPSATATLADVTAAYEAQMEAIERDGGRLVIMASRALCATARSKDDYEAVYGRLLSHVRQPALIHWLGPMFDPDLQGYWGSDDLDEATEVLLSIVKAHAEKVDGIKISLLDQDREVAMRRRLPPGVRMYTGDDFNFAELIEGDSEGFSDALLGIFDAIAPAASAALGALARGDRDRYRRILAPCVPLSRHIFGEPTRCYKTGVVFLAWLNGHQDRFVLLDRQERSRSLVHLAELFRLAAHAGVLRDPDLAVERMRAFCRSVGTHA